MLYDNRKSRSHSLFLLCIRLLPFSMPMSSSYIHVNGHLEDATVDNDEVKFYTQVRSGQVIKLRSMLS